MNNLKSTLLGLTIAGLTFTNAQALNLSQISNIDTKNHIEISTISLTNAKNNGLVGERPDGLLIAVKRSAEIAGLITEINSKRMKKYQELAKKHGVSVAVIQKQAGSKLIQTMPKGHYYLSNSGNLVVK